MTREAGTRSLGVVLPAGTSHCIGDVGGSGRRGYHSSTHRRDGPRPKPSASEAPSRSVSLISDNRYRNLGLRGRVVQVNSEEQGAGAGINRLAKKYLGVEEYPYRAPGERRVQFWVLPEVVSGWGKD